ncbi:nucleotidyltransferase domain-containing protein [Candidatus Palauibacter sp.]|uniref:nucleotidyltransferase domain-containing protein n=1 Tax=Candidatus Palauibacter sp. TaxID=3101350 RepID=UPI003B029196
MRSPDPSELRLAVESNRDADTLRRFLAALRPLLREHSARSAWIVGSHARGTAGPESDIDVIVVAPTRHPSVERFRDYLPAIIAAGVGVDLVVYTPAEFERLRGEGRPFLRHAMQSAMAIEV